MSSTRTISIIISTAIISDSFMDDIATSGSLFD